MNVWLPAVAKRAKRVTVFMMRRRRQVGTRPWAVEQSRQFLFQGSASEVSSGGTLKEATLNVSVTSVERQQKSGSLLFHQTKGTMQCDAGGTTTL